MPENTEAPETPDVPEDTAPDPAPTESETFDADYVRKLRAEAAKYRTEAKANAEKAKRLDEIEEASKSEQQRLVERAEAAEKSAADATSRLLRAEVAADKGLTPTMAARLVGSTKEELEADADALLADLSSRFAPKSASPVDTGAGVGGSPAKHENPEEIASRLKAKGYF